MSQGRGGSRSSDRGRSDGDGRQGARLSSPQRSNSQYLLPPLRGTSTSRGRGGSQERGGGRGRGSRSRSSSGSRFPPPEVFCAPQGVIPQPDAAVRKAEDEYIKNSSGIGSLALLNLSGNNPRRPGHGTQGTPVVVYANFFDIKPVANLAFYRYFLDVQPEGRAPKPSKPKIKRIITLLLNEPHFKGALTDFRSTLFSRRKIENLPRNVVIPFRAEGEDDQPEFPMNYQITVHETGNVQITDLLDYLKSTKVDEPVFATQAEGIQALNVLIGHHPQMRPDLVAIGPSSHFSINGQGPNPGALGTGIEVLRGYYKSVRTATSRLLLNVNMSHAICYEAVRLDEYLNNAGVNHNNKPMIAKRLNLLRLERLHIIKKDKDGKWIPSNATFGGFADPLNDGFSDEHPPKVHSYGAGPKDVKFWFTENGAKSTPLPTGAWRQTRPAGRYISVWDYFTQNYPTIEMDPKIPVINVGSSRFPRYLPAEACKILPGQPSKKKLTSWETRQMIEFACRTPKANAESIIRDGRDILGLAPPRSNALAEIGLTFGSCLITVSARVLQPPQIKYQSKYVNTANGDWSTGDNKYAIGTKIKRWTYIWLRSEDTGRDFGSESALQTKVRRFMKLMRERGIELGEPLKGANGYEYQVIDSENNDGTGHDRVISLIEKMANSAEDRRPDFLLIVLPDNKPLLYSKIKTCADINAGINTVCVVGNKFAKTHDKTHEDQYFNNVALKFNLKAGGINHLLDAPKLGIISEGRTMVMGIDVTHPSPGSKATAPSVAGVVASVDKNLGQWPADLRIQESRQEMVSVLDDMVKSRLLLWGKINKALPENILVYRDGVSEGQYSIVLEKELPLIRKACKALYPANYQGPKISLVIVGKRHHYRFYPSKSEEADRSWNCKAGTIVDRGVTTAKDWDFFLQAHACIQGTARPAHYVVLLDEIFCKSKLKARHKNAADALEELTHNMCHLFGRATKAVSVCPPAYYADLVCERARCYLARLSDPQPQKQQKNYDQMTGQPNADPDGADQGPSAEDVIVHERLRDTMFYI